MKSGWLVIWVHAHTAVVEIHIYTTMIMGYVTTALLYGYTSILLWLYVYMTTALLYGCIPHHFCVSTHLHHHDYRVMWPPTVLRVHIHTTFVWVHIQTIMVILCMTIPLLFVSTYTPLLCECTSRLSWLYGYMTASLLCKSTYTQLFMGTHPHHLGCMDTCLHKCCIWSHLHYCCVSSHLHHNEVQL